MRIGINIADDLLKRMAPLRSVINVSEICRRAIENHVQAYEQAKKRAEEDGMDAVAERLAQQLEEPEVDWKGLGLQDARMWAEMATPEDWEYLQHRLDVWIRQGHLPYDVPVPHVEGVKGFYQREHENKEWMIRQFDRDAKSDHFLAAKARYDLAFVSYLIAVWEKAKGIEQRLAATNTAAMAKAYEDSRAKVELPSALANTGTDPETPPVAKKNARRRRSKRRRQAK